MSTHNNTIYRRPKFLSPKAVVYSDINSNAELIIPDGLFVNKIAKKLFQKSVRLSIFDRKTSSKRSPSPKKKLSKKKFSRKRLSKKTPSPKRSAF